jgi:hypothetical protein
MNLVSKYKEAVLARCNTHKPCFLYLGRKQMHFIHGMSGFLAISRLN